MKQTTAINVIDVTIATSMFWQNATDPVEYKITLHTCIRNDYNMASYNNCQEVIVKSRHAITVGGVAKLLATFFFFFIFSIHRFVE